LVLIYWTMVFEQFSQNLAFALHGSFYAKIVLYTDCMYALNLTTEESENVKSVMFAAGARFMVSICA
jgi:hypothetical protein